LEWIVSNNLEKLSYTLKHKWCSSNWFPFEKRLQFRSIRSFRKVAKRWL